MILHKYPRAASCSLFLGDLTHLDLSIEYYALSSTDAPLTLPTTVRANLVRYRLAADDDYSFLHHMPTRDGDIIARGLFLFPHPLKEVSTPVFMSARNVVADPCCLAATRERSHYPASMACKASSFRYFNVICLGSKFHATYSAS